MISRLALQLKAFGIPAGFALLIVLAVWVIGWGLIAALWERVTALRRQRLMTPIPATLACSVGAMVDVLASTNQSLSSLLGSDISEALTNLFHITVVTASFCGFILLPIYWTMLLGRRLFGTDLAHGLDSRYAIHPHQNESDRKPHG